MRSKFVQLTHRFPVLEYVFSIVSFFVLSLLLVVALVLTIGFLSAL